MKKYALIYCNGTFVGEYKGGYTSFSVEITEQIRWGEQNVIALAVSARRDDEFGNIPPMIAGNFNVYDGIYRGVRLVVTNPIHIPFRGTAEYDGGVFVTTLHVSREQAEVQITTHVRNASTLERAVQVTHRVLDAEGRNLATLQASTPLKAGEQSSLQQSTLIESARLWSTQEPYLYKVETSLSDASRVLDVHEASLGFRWFYWDYETDMLRGTPPRPLPCRCRVLWMSRPSKTFTPTCVLKLCVR